MIAKIKLPKPKDSLTPNVVLAFAFYTRASFILHCGQNYRALLAFVPSTAGGWGWDGGELLLDGWERWAVEEREGMDGNGDEEWNKETKQEMV